MLNTILLGIVVIELGIIAWNTKKKKVRKTTEPIILSVPKGKENTKLKDIF